MARLKVSAVRNGGSLLESSPTCSGIGGAVDWVVTPSCASARVRCSRHARALAMRSPPRPARPDARLVCVGPFSKPRL